MRKNLVLILAVAALPARLCGVETQWFSAQLSALDFSAFKPAAQQAPPSAPAYAPAQFMGEPLYAIDLKPLLGNIRGTSAVFLAGRTKVHVYGEKSQNKNSWFMGFAAEDGTVLYRNGRKMLRYKAGGFLPLKGGTAEVRLGGRDYRVHIQGQLSDRMQSKVVIEPREAAEGKTVFTIDELSRNAYAAGYPVRIGGVEYRLIYSEDFNEDADGEFSGFTRERSIVLLHRENGKISAFHWFESEIPRDSVLIATPRSANSDDGYDQGQLTLGLSLTGSGQLRVYYPVPVIAAGR